MEQHLIVEGNDAIALANIFQKIDLKPPQGYNNTHKFQKEFVVNAQGIDNVTTHLGALLKKNISNIGVVLDADEDAGIRKAQVLKFLLANNFYTITEIEAAKVIGGGTLYSGSQKSTLGVWIMPDNNAPGYLEHFLGNLIRGNDALWPYAKQVLSNLPEQKFSEVKTQKALLHSWLAWQKTPGMPFGQAIQAGYFDLNTTSVSDFAKWFSATFKLEQ